MARQPAGMARLSSALERAAARAVAIAAVHEQAVRRAHEAQSAPPVPPTNEQGRGNG